MSQPPNRKALIWAGVCCLALAILHLAMIFIGAPAYEYFGAGERMVELAQSGSFLPAGLTILVALVLAGFGAYAFSGAGMLRHLPLLRPGLWVIGGLLTLRGLGGLALAAYLLAGPGVPFRKVLFSLAALLLGLLFIRGLRGGSLRAN